MRILVVSHDAGGAEVISAWVKKNRSNIKFDYCLQGPARSIFSLKLSEINILNANSIDFKRYDKVVSGTSWQSDFERLMIRRARVEGVRSAAYLDHWVNYRERFGYPAKNWRDNLPDEIWCGDKNAFDICTKLGFLPNTLKLVENEYFHQIQEEAKRYECGIIPNSILYVCEPISEHMKKEYDDEFYLGYNEFTAMHLFFETLMKSDLQSSQITIRLHPSENDGKYDSVIKNFKNFLPIKVSRNKHLYKDIQRSETIVGCESMALVVALLLDKKVFTVIPPRGVPCRLPHKEIRSFYQYCRSLI